MDALHVYDWQDVPLCEAEETIDDILKPLIDFACDKGVIEDTVANRDLFDEGWMPKTIMVAREQEMQNIPLEGQTKINLEQFVNTSKFLVPAEDRILIDYLQSIGAKYEVYGQSQDQYNVVLSQQQLQEGKQNKKHCEGE